MDVVEPRPKSQFRCTSVLSRDEVARLLDVTTCFKHQQGIVGGGGQPSTYMFLKAAFVSAKVRSTYSQAFSGCREDVDEPFAGIRRCRRKEEERNMSAMASDVIRKTSIFAVVVGGVLCASPLSSARGPGAALASDLADPTGTWLVKDGDARIRIERCPRPQDRVCGYIVWTKDAGGGDDKNPDPTRRGRAILGMQMLLGLAPDGAAYSGPVYNAENGKTYDSHVRRDDASHLILKGCVLKYLCQSQTWTRVDDVAPGQLKGPTNSPDGPRTDPEWAKVVTARKQKR